MNKSERLSVFSADNSSVDGYRDVRKATAKYYSIVVNGKKNKDAAWYYPNPKPGTEMVKGRIAFWKGVKVS